MRPHGRFPAWLAYLDLPLARRRGWVPLSLGKALLRAGVPCLRLRAPADEVEGLVRLARLLAPEARARNVPLLLGSTPLHGACAVPVEGRMIAADADVHLLPDAGLLGVNLHAGQRVAPWVSSADFVVIAPVWLPSSKPARRPAIGIEGFVRLKERVPLPAYALGGVTPERWPALVDAGAWGPALLGPLHGPDPERIVGEWNRILERPAGGAPCRNG